MGIESSDSLLATYLQTLEAAESQQLIAALISEHAEPVIKKIVNYKLLARRGDGRGDDRQFEVEEVHGEIVVQLLQRLRNLKSDDVNRPISDFRGYVATVAYNACDRYVSRKYPQRRRLKNGLRYLLTHRAGLALWKGAHDEWLAGLAAWRGEAAPPNNDDHARAPTPEHARRLQQLRDDPHVFARQTGNTGATPAQNLSDQKNAVELLHRIFKWTRCPVELDELVSVVAAWWNVKEHEASSADGGEFDESGEDAVAELVDSREGIDAEVERRAYLARLWNEISQLPPRQRAAVLLNLRDAHGDGVIDLWTLTGLVAPDRIACALSVTLETFAEMLAELPFDDRRIASHLGITRQQVINLRKSARERLARRMKSF